MYAEKAKELFEQGYNCAQAVFCAFNDLIGIEFETAVKLSSSFGGGLGRLREVCGAVSGGAMVLGYLYGYTDISDDTVKKEHYALIQSFANDFAKVNGSYICKELLGLKEKENSPVPTERTTAFYKKRPCGVLVYEAAKWVEHYIETNK